MSAAPAERARVGLIGCGIIAKAYAEGAVAFDSFSVEACADSDAERAEALAAGHGLEVMSVEGLISSSEIDVILNLTPPAVHAAVVGGALEAGKHVYTEKPLTTSLPIAQELVASADRLGLRIGCAPDTFLSSAYEAARALIKRGDIGEPLGATATMLVGGPDNWHPNADFFYRAGGGPMLDLAPYYLTAIASLLGPFASAVGFATTPTPERTLGVGPRKGEKFTVDVPTHVAAALRLESGALATLTVSFESRGRYDSRMTVHGTEGALSLPDANQFDGDLAVFNGAGEWEAVPYASRGAQETRGYGLHEMLEAVREKRPHRASGELGLHVLETATAVLRSAEEGRTIDVVSRFTST
jgi:predicted dehydrogenase